METNKTYSGVGTLKEDDLVNSITVKYKDTTKENKTYTVNSITSNTVTEIMQFLSGANLTLGDTLSFNVTRNNETQTVEFEIVQFIYSI